MGQPIQPSDLQFTTREFYLDGGDDYAKGSTLSFQDLDTTLIFLSNSIANVSPSLNTSSLLLTASANSNVITFTKGDGTTQFAVTIDTGSAVTVNTGSLLLTASANLNTITFTKGDGTPFTITIDTGSGQTYTAGDGLNLVGNIFSSKVLTVNGQNPDGSGNITTALTAVETGNSASLVQSSSGAITASITNGTVWVISEDGDATKNGDTYIFKSGSVGQWYQISPLDEVAGDARYVRLSATSTQNITSSLLISGSTTFTGSLSWSGSLNANGATANVVVLSNGQLYVTGAYGSGGATPGGADKTIQFNDGGSTLSGSGTFTFDKTTNTASISGSLLSTGSLISSGSLRVIGTETITGSLIVSSSSNVIGTSRVTGSLTVSSSTDGQTVLQVTGTGSLTSSPLVQIAGQNGGFIQIYDSNSGSLFSVNNNTGTAIVDVRSNGQTLIGSNTFQGMYDSTANIAFASPSQNLTIPGYITSSYNALWFDYSVSSGSYSRMGTLYSSWSGSNISYNDVTGSYTGTVPANNIALVTRFSSSFVQITASAATNNWVIKGMIRCI